MIQKQALKFHPYLKSVIWGGEKICSYKGVEQSDPNIGESWEISEVPGHESVVAEGPYQGKNLTELIKEFGAGLLGTAVLKKYGGKFPLLIKFIDANDNLSIQVHPDDELAEKRHGSLGKTEMWYIIDAEENAKIYAGFKDKITAEEYVERIGNDTFTDVLAVHDSKPGDVFFLPAGRVHAIGAGNLLAEIQETSDITYRIYDYNRKGIDGKPRELHTEQAKDAIDYAVYDNYKNPPVAEGVSDSEIVKCAHFTTRLIKLSDRQAFKFDETSFTIIICVEGETEITGADGSTKIKRGESVLLPAAMTDFEVKGNATLLLARS